MIKKQLQNLSFILAVFGIYLYTAYPSISPYRDSGDLICSGYTLGIAHPPGYPLYSLLAKIFTILIPFGNIAYRVNLMSVFFTACTAFVLMLILGKISTRWAAFLLSGVFVFSKAVWSLSHVSEMYTLSIFFVALLFLIAVKNETGTRDLFLFSLIFGLGLGTHPAIVLLLPGFLVFLYYKAGKRVKPVNISVILFFLAAGISVYLYLPLRSIKEPILDWGNPQTARNFFRVITRADYGGLKLHPAESKFIWNIPSIYSQVVLFVKSVISQYSVAGLLLGVISVFLIFIRKNFLQISVIFTGLLITGPGFFILSNLPVSENTTLPILEPHLIMPCFLFILLTGYLLSADNIKSALPRACAIAVVFLILVQNLFLNFKQENRRNNFFAYDLGRNIFNSVKKDSILYDLDDATTFISMYMKYCENKREDIKLFSFFRTRWGYEQLKRLYPEILPPYDIPSAQELTRSLFEYNTGPGQKRTIYTDIAVKVPPPYIPLSNGVVYAVTNRVYPVNERPDFFSLYFMRGDYNTLEHTDFFTNRIIYYYASAYSNLGIEYFNSGYPGQAKQCYSTAIGMDPTLKEAYNNLGTVAYTEKNFSLSIKLFREALLIKPSDAGVLYNLGLSYKAENDLAGAEKVFDDMLKIEKSPRVENELGLIALEKGNTEKAIAAFESIINAYPGYDLAYYNLSLAYRKTGNLPKSEYFYNMYHKLNKEK